MTTVARDEESGPDVRIREAERADLLAVFHIEQEAFPQPWPFSAFERFLGESGFLVAQVRDDEDSRETATVGDDGRVVGYVVADVVPNHGESLGHIKDIAVAEERRSEGIGRRLLQRGLTALAAQNVASVKLEVRESNDTAKRLYEGFGFERKGTLPRYYSNGEDAFVMVREF
ncbi:ribosomal protein S18-alanine N-acetyltransferase [Halosimplex salinum]|uniref:ribosomal protein S18-alanine N-acetyltransferase n=1 Tax=Halosimplex salinum TaxID=1710538 RepID=UPI000F46782B|nr:ribosomal protein S18-alanine N-acetyltransferase [Halosimplex salinum]